MDELFRQIGRYEILGRIGTGGFATVYRARDTNLDREVAVKVMRPLLLSDAAFVQRFRQEARTVANLDHANIVPIYDYGEIEDRLCLVMKLLGGGSLAELVTQGPVPWPRVVQLSAQIAAALDYAHERGLVHRDIKPENVLLDGEGNAVLGDFGLVRALESGRLTTSLSGGVLGTPAYLAPEVWNGLAGTPATDVYGMACVVFEMVTGKQLFDAPTPPATMMLHFRSPQFPERWPPDVPPGLERVLRRALARNPEDRYPSAGAFAAELAALEDDPLAERYAALEAAVAAEQWDDAVALAERIVDEAPGYREARQLLEQASEGRIAVQQQAWAAQWAAAAKRALADGDQEGALTAARHWQQLAPDDGEAAAMVERLQGPSVEREVEPEPVVEKVTFAAPESAPVEAVESGGGAAATRLADWRWRTTEEEVVEAEPPGRRRQQRLPEVQLPLTRPVISYVLAALIVIVFVLEELAGGSTNPQVLSDFGMMQPWMLSEGQYWRFIVALFLHDGLAAVALHVFALYVVGREVEERYGYRRFLFLYFAAGLLANILAFAWYGDGLGRVPRAMVGAQGAVFGILGVQLAFFLFQSRLPVEKRMPGAIESPRLVYVTIAFVIVTGLAFARFIMLFPVIGLASGLVLGYLLAPRYEVDDDAPGGFQDRATLRRRWWVVAGTLLLIGFGLLFVP